MEARTEANIFEVLTACSPAVLADIFNKKNSDRPRREELCEENQTAVLTQITQIYADKRQVGEMDLLKQIPQITQIKTGQTRVKDMWFVFCLRLSARSARDIGV